jgi:hypothetical protein
MTRPYSPKLLDTVENAGTYRLGLDLANTCIKAGLPAAYIAQVFDTTRMTIHTWFRGGAIRFSKRERIEIFIKLVEEDTRKGLLPCKNLRDARAYLKDMIGRPIKAVSHKKPD